MKKQEIADLACDLTVTVQRHDRQIRELNLGSARIGRTVEVNASIAMGELTGLAKLLGEQADRVTTLVGQMGSHKRAIGEHAEKLGKVEQYVHAVARRRDTQVAELHQRITEQDKQVTMQADLIGTLGLRLLALENAQTEAAEPEPHVCYGEKPDHVVKGMLLSDYYKIRDSIRAVLADCRGSWLYSDTVWLNLPATVRDALSAHDVRDYLGHMATAGSVELHPDGVTMAYRLAGGS